MWDEGASLNTGIGREFFCLGMEEKNSKCLMTSHFSVNWKEALSEMEKETVRRDRSVWKINGFNKYLLSIYYAPGPFLYAKDYR